ncbi:hypothetical protein FB451DRAFT_1395437 [Mycena latifolia]|nr:hypothetical protein FB451DRAFT_1395437 [Mycena latifolia]
MLSSALFRPLDVPRMHRPADRATCCFPMKNRRLLVLNPTLDSSARQLLPLPIFYVRAIDSGPDAHDRERILPPPYNNICWNSYEELSQGTHAVSRSETPDLSCLPPSTAAPFKLTAPSPRSPPCSGSFECIDEEDGVPQSAPTFPTRCARQCAHRRVGLGGVAALRAFGPWQRIRSLRIAERRGRGGARALRVSPAPCPAPPLRSPPIPRHRVPPPRANGGLGGSVLPVTFPRDLTDQFVLYYSVSDVRASPGLESLEPLEPDATSGTVCWW